MMTDGTRQSLLARTARHAETYLEEVGERRVGASATGDEVRRLLDRPLSDGGDDPAHVVDDLARAGHDATVATQGPRYFGFVVGGSLPVATAADWLVSTWDQNAGLFVLSPVAAVAEDVATRWIREIVGLEPHWTAGFVTGCQMANFTALAVARHHVLRAAGWDVERDGLFGAPPIDVIVSAESHYTIFTALRMLGLGADRLTRIETDEQGRMRADALARAIENLDTASPKRRQDGSDAKAGPCIICAQAGNVNTGAFDPLTEIVPLARRRGAWLHVDGAFGLWAAASPSLRALVEGIQHADSIATDGHKWLNVPYDCGIVLTAHREAHRRTLTLAAHYIQETTTERDPHEFTPEESRRARGVPVYAALRALGRRGLCDLVERCCSHARRMAAALARHPRVRILNDIVLNQVLVQFIPPEGDPRGADAFTRAVVEAVQAEGVCWLGLTTWQGMTAMRVSVSNWSTTESDIDRSADAILRVIH